MHAWRAVLLLSADMNGVSLRIPTFVFDQAHPTSCLFNKRIYAAHTNDMTLAAPRQRRHATHVFTQEKCDICLRSITKRARSRHLRPPATKGSPASRRTTPLRARMLQRTAPRRTFDHCILPPFTRAPSAAAAHAAQRVTDKYDTNSCAHYHKNFSCCFTATVALLERHSLSRAPLCHAEIRLRCTAFVREAREARRPRIWIRRHGCKVGGQVAQAQGPNADRGRPSAPRARPCISTRIMLLLACCAKKF